MAIFSGKFDKVVVILSTGRTGTMALARRFDEAWDEVRALHEPRPNRHLRIASNRHLCGRMSASAAAGLFAASRRRLFRAVRQPIYIESNNFLHGFLDVLGLLFDRPRVVHVVRDPRTFIRSWIDFGVFRGLKGFVGRYVPYWLLKPELIEPRPQRRWKDMPPPERIGWYWNAVNAVLDRAEALFGGDYLRLRFEDLFTADLAAIRGLAEWIGLPDPSRLGERATRQKVNASQPTGSLAWEQMDAAGRQAILGHCRERMGRYGYDVPGE